MKQPKLNNLRFNREATSRLRQQMRSSKKVKITINIDHDNLEALKSMASQSGSSYQKLLNQVLREGLGIRNGNESRLDRLEKEVEKLKRRIA